MWPWDHVAVAYLMYAVYGRARGRQPSSTAAVVVVVAAVAPDLIDKPLAWWLSVLPSGRSLGHSLFTGVASVAGAAVVQRRTGIVGLTPGVAIGYLSHLAGDVAYPLVTDGELRVEFLFWPLVPAAPGEVDGAAAHLGELVVAFIAYLSTPAGVAYLLAEMALLVAALIVWIRDGAPGTRRLRAVVGDRVR